MNELNEKQKKFLMALRQGLLLIVDAIESYVGMDMRTAEVRKVLKALQKQGKRV